MTNITNYSYLIQSMLGSMGSSWGTGSTLPGMFQFSQLNSSSIQAQLKAAGIDTSSKQYKASIEYMKKNGCTSSMYASIQGIKNLMKDYNSDGEWVDPNTGLTGLLATDESWKRIVEIPESSRDEIFEYVKNNYLQNNGMSDGTGKTEIYTDLYTKMEKEDRLSAGWTLTQYRKAYSQAIVTAIKTADPTWSYGKAIPSGVLDGITRESIESTLVKSGNTLKVNSVDYRV